MIKGIWKTFVKRNKFDGDPRDKENNQNANEKKDWKNHKKNTVLNLKKTKKKIHS